MADILALALLQLHLPVLRIARSRCLNYQSMIKAVAERADREWDVNVPPRGLPLRRQAGMGTGLIY